MEVFFHNWATIFSSELKLEKISCFKKISDKLHYIINSDVIDKYSNLNIRQDMDLFVDSLNLDKGKHLKSKERSHLLKKEGIESYVCKRTTEALEIFTEALRYTPMDDTIMPFLYGNRSAALFRLKLYDECIADISRALHFNCPVLKPKLLLRKIKCHIKLGQRHNAAEALEKFMQNIGFSEKTNNYQDEIIIFENEIKCMEKVENPVGYDDIPSLYFGKSAKIAQMSSALEIRENNKFGRHIVAIEPIKKGSILLIEEPFAYSLLSTNCHSHCSNCFKYARNPIMCDNCVDVVWCGEQCRDKSIQFHHYECNILSILTSMGLSHLAVRTVLMADWNACLGIEKRSEVLDAFQLINPNYNDIQALISHFDAAPDIDQLHYCLIGYILAMLLFHKTDFVPAEHKNSRIKLIKLSSILTEHIAQLAVNACTITKVTTETDAADSMINFKNEVVGSAIYATASIFNHACQPSIMKIFYGKKLVVCAKTDIEVGSQVYNCYGPCTSMMQREERRDALKRQYFFDCACVSCDDVEADLNEAKWSGIKCPKCTGVARWTDEEFSSVQCLSCRMLDPSPSVLVQNCVKLNNIYTEGLEFLSKRILNDAEAKLTEALALAEDTLCEQNIFLNEIRSSYVKILILNHNFTSTMKSFQTCLKYTAERFGKYSIECCLYLLGYLYIIDQCSNDKSHLSEMTYMQKEIEQILTVCYGTHWKTISDCKF